MKTLIICTVWGVHC